MNGSARGASAAAAAVAATAASAAKSLPFRAGSRKRKIVRESRCRATDFVPDFFPSKASELHLNLF